MSKKSEKKKQAIKELEEFIDVSMNGLDCHYLFSDRATEEYKLAVKLYNKGYRYLPQADKENVKHC